MKEAVTRNETPPSQGRWFVRSCLLVLASFVSVPVAVRTLPYRVGNENLLVSMFVLFALLWGLALFYGMTKCERLDYRFIPLIVLMVGFGPALFSLVDRHAVASKLRWMADGEIVEKKPSVDPSFLAIRVRGGNGTLKDFEGVTIGFWEQVSVGDRFRKGPFSPDASVNGRDLRMVDAFGLARPLEYDFGPPPD